MAIFTYRLDIRKKVLKSLFQYSRFTISANIHKQWGNYKVYYGDYKLKVDPCVSNNVSKTASETLNEMHDSGLIFTIQPNNGKRYALSSKTCHIRCLFSKLALEHIKRLFVSSIVYNAKGLSLPEEEHEFVDFMFDTGKKTVTITGLRLYEPDDPFFEYARNVVSTLSVESIGIGNYAPDKNQIRDFYNYTMISDWKRSDLLFHRVNGAIEDIGGEPTLEGKVGIYMLYDEQNNHFYVGKSKNIRQRIIQHAENRNNNDPIPDFTHYRYSLINMEYIEFLYLIENAAIHDCAMLLDMPKASRIRKSLAKKTGKSLNDCKIVNRVERQTRAEKK